MIVTDIGAKQLADNDKVTIDKVVFSDFDFNLVTNDQMQAMTGFSDNDNVVVTPDVALLANNHVIVQADAPAVDFRINSVFLFGTGQPTGDVFLLAVDENQSGTFSQELDINAIRKLSFNATSNDIVLQSDLQSMVDVAYKSAQASYALDSENDAIYLMAKSFTNSIASSKADIASLSSYATVSSVDSLSNAVSTEFNSYTSQLASKADTAMLSSYMTTDSIDSVADSISSNVTSKANEIELSGYAKTSDFNSLSAVVSETDSGLSTKANTNDVNALSSAINDSLNSKANINDLSNYAKSDDVSSAMTQASNSLASSLQFFSSSAIAFANSVNTNSNVQSSFNGYMYSEYSKLESWVVNNNAQILANRDSMASSLSNYGSLTSHVDFLQSKADTDAGNIINNNKMINDNSNSVSISIKSLSDMINSQYNSATSSLSNVKQSNDTNANLLSQLKQTALQYYGVWKGNVLDLATQPDGIYEMYANQQGCPENYDGYGFVIKIHNTWNSLLLLFDNNFFQWTNRQGAQGWNGWRQLVDTVMLADKLAQNASGTTLSANDDYNNLTTSGNYVLPVAYSYAHSPIDGKATIALNVINDGFGDVFQQAYVPNIIGVYYRQYSSNHWSDWQLK